MSADVAWAAGFIDGEGTITIVRSKNNMVLTLCAYNRDERALHKLASLFGGHVMRNVHKNAPANHSPAHQWRVQGWKAAQAIERLIPFLIVKGEQARLGLEYQKTIQGEGGQGGGKQVSENTWVFREVLKGQMTLLNQRGPKSNVS